MAFVSVEMGRHLVRVGVRVRVRVRVRVSLRQHGSGAPPVCGKGVVVGDSSEWA